MQGSQNKNNNNQSFNYCSLLIKSEKFVFICNLDLFEIFQNLGFNPTFSSLMKNYKTILILFLFANFVSMNQNGTEKKGIYATSEMLIRHCLLHNEHLPLQMKVDL